MSVASSGSVCPKSKLNRVIGGVMGAEIKHRCPLCISRSVCLMVFMADDDEGKLQFGAQLPESSRIRKWTFDLQIFTSVTIDVSCVCLMEFSCVQSYPTAGFSFLQFSSLLPAWEHWWHHILFQCEVEGQFCWTEHLIIILLGPQPPNILVID